MANIIYLEAFTSQEEYQKEYKIRIPVESLITYCVNKYCKPKNFNIYFVSCDNRDCSDVVLHTQEVNFIEQKNIPWQAASCKMPVAMCDETVITGLCAVSRYMSKFRNVAPSVYEHEDGLLGFRRSCLQAPNEVSIWTKFCEVDIIKTVMNILKLEDLTEIPINMVRFENHLNKPVRVHNIYKVARELNRDKLTSNGTSEIVNNNIEEESTQNLRIPKLRKWKSNAKKNLEINNSIKREDLPLNHEFAEGPFLTLADMLLLPSYHILIQKITINIVKEFLPLTHNWYLNLINMSEVTIIKNILDSLCIESLKFENLLLPATEDVSLYKLDPKRHNPKKRLFTKPEDIEKALTSLTEDLELHVDLNNFNDSINWDDIPEGANPSAGHLPDERINRKSQQLENLALAVTSMAKDGDLIVDFCSGSGHLGILIAYLLPKCTIILLENKEQSLLRARDRVLEMKLKNIYFFQCNLDFFIGKFDIGVALHACGIATDLVLDKCLMANAKFVLCPCCYGSLHATDRLEYPRSDKFKCLSLEEYLCISHTADQTHKEHPLSVRGARCMAIIDSDRGRLAEECGYTVTLSRLKPLSCTPKNNLLIGVPS